MTNSVEKKSKLHQVVDTWSPWSMLPVTAKNHLRNTLRRTGFSVEFVSLFRYELDMLLLRLWCKMSRKYRRQVRGFQGRRDLKIHLGCGNTLKPGWVNVDCYPPRPEPNCEIVVIDMRRGLPFADESAQSIYSEHLFEHIPIETIRTMLLSECFRILAPGGVIRVGVPDGELWIDAYLAKRENGRQSRFISNQPTPMMSVNDIARHYGHCFLWDYETLSYAFLEAGFADLREARAGDTQVDCFVSMDQTEEWRIAQTVYIEGRRPRVSLNE